ncbi:hypothetical protein [Undibacterium sp. TJN25]|uniref:hypothetical protein n=1 Tax=Undibacterium sp. TJN25 TaxID=3413056 RepID=UPI003BF4EF30
MLPISVYVFRFYCRKKNAEPERYLTFPAPAQHFFRPFYSLQLFQPTNSFASLPAKLQMECRYFFFMLTATILPITAYHLRPR